MNSHFHGLKAGSLAQFCCAGALTALCTVASAQHQIDQPYDPLHYGPFDMLYSIRGTVMYDDNIFISKDKESDVLWIATPSAKIAMGDHLEQEENFITLEYAPSFILF